MTDIEFLDYVAAQAVIAVLEGDPVQVEAGGLFRLRALSGASPIHGYDPKRGGTDLIAQSWCRVMLRRAQERLA